MDFGWLKRVLPRGLYGRAALILLVPVVTLQIVVSGQILQRYFRDVAAQMTTALVLDLDLLRSRMAEGEPVEALAEALEIGIAPAPDGTLTDRRLFYDLTGAEAIRVLHRDLPGLIAVDLVSDERFPAVILRAGDEIVSLSVSRRRLSASNSSRRCFFRIVRWCVLRVLYSGRSINRFVMALFALGLLSLWLPGSHPVSMAHPIAGATCFSIQTSASHIP